jgi:hypothetical protein
MLSQKKAKDSVSKRYPLSSVLIYHRPTIVHFSLGGIAIMVGDN